MKAGQVEPRASPLSNTDVVVDLIAQKVQGTDSRISAKHFLPVARPAGYTAGRATSDAEELAAVHARSGRPPRTWRGQTRSWSGAMRSATSASDRETYGKRAASIMPGKP